MTQADINASVDWAISRFSGQRVADEFGGYVGECVSLMRREYIHRFGEATCPNTPNGWGDGYTQLPGAFKSRFTLETFNRNKDYPKGSYAINAPSHHIMIYLNRVGTNVSVFEQNADPDGAAAHTYTRDGARITHMLVPIITQQTTNQGGTNVTLSTDDVQQLYRNILGRDGDAGGVKNYTGKTLAFALADMMNSQEFKNRMQGMYQVTKTVEVPVNTGSAATPRQLAAEKAIDALSAAINVK